MKNSFLVVVGLISILFSNEVRAQSKLGEVALGITGIAALALEIDALFELLELQATRQVIETRPDQNAFKVKVLKRPGSKITDISLESVLVYEVTFYDKFTQNEVSKEVLVAFTSPNWINGFGVEYSLITWRWFDKEEWNDLFATFIEIASPSNVESGMVGTWYEIDEDEFVNGSDQIIIRRMGDGSISTNEYFQKANEQVSIAELKLEAKKFDCSRDKMINSGLERLLVPIYDIGRDQYLTGEFSEDLVLVVNEGALGIYLKSTGRLVQIPRVTVSAIQEFVNSELTTLDISDVRGIITSINTAVQGEKTEFKIGDKGFFEISRETWIEIEIIEVESNYGSTEEFILTIQYLDDGRIQDRKVRSDSDKLRWQE